MRTVEEQYQKKTPIEHILLRPDTYIGSVERESQSLFVFSHGKIHNRVIDYVPGLYKIFDEILVNAADNKIRDPKMTYIKVTLGPVIVVENDGKGIPIVKHKKENVYVPELIFGQLLTSSNYDDNEKKVTGGRNGYGAKLCNIFSKHFVVETRSKNKYYKQRFFDNMSAKEDPDISDLTFKNDSELKELLINKTPHADLSRIINAQNDIFSGDQPTSASNLFLNDISTPSRDSNSNIYSSLKSISHDNIKGDFTRISFEPDLKRFGLTSISDDFYALLVKRVHDLCATVPGISVYLNGTKLRIDGFSSYCKLYFSDTDSVFLHSKISPRWEIAVSIAEDGFSQVSFVNSICTSKGGTHVNHVLEQICDPLCEIIKKKEKGLVVKPAQIKQALCLYINCLIENPSFDSQTKENMTLNPRKFGSKCEPIENFVKNLAKNQSIIDKIVGLVKAKQSIALKKTDGSRSSRLTGIPKLDDANCAGTKQGHKCTLILTEGDSAKTLAVSGLSVVGRDYFGVFPLRGKLLNVRDASTTQIVANQEITALKKIIGLQHNKEYADTSSLRYGHIMIMTDQDHDGSHIKGLLINFFDIFYPSLLKIPQFLQEFITPIVRAFPKKKAKNLKHENTGSRMVNTDNEADEASQAADDDLVIDPNLDLSLRDPNYVPPPLSAAGTLDFFTLPEFYTWYVNTPDVSKRYTTKYYKGLGTSTPADAKHYFGDLKKHVKDFGTLTTNDRELLALAFSKKYADRRKGWLAQMDPRVFLDNKNTIIPISDFVNKELILFSMADNVRSIPSIIDGLKPGQRKVLFACFKRNLRNEIKVAQLAGYVSEKAAYHHGEASLYGTIINLAQNFVGSNNINVLTPSGQFGTRLQGGKDAASPRYLFTSLEKITRLIFRPEDDHVLKYLTDDNQSIEPEYYVPIVPMVLVNGADGIGTGWSSSIPNYHVRDIIKNIKNIMENRPMVEMVPYYKGYTGTIIGIQDSGTPGNSQTINTLEEHQTQITIQTNSEFTPIVENISDMPLRLDTNVQTTGVESLATPFLGTYAPRFTKFAVNGIYHVNGDIIDINELPIGSWTQNYKEFLETLVASNSIRDFKEYHTENTVYFKIINNNIHERQIEKKLKLSSTIAISNLVCFDSKLKIKRYGSPLDIISEFYKTRMHFYALRKEYLLKNLFKELKKIQNRVRFIREIINESLVVKKRKKADVEDELNLKKYDKIDNTFDYLLNMPILSMTLEKIQNLEEEQLNKQQQYDTLISTSLKQLWLNDLKELEEQLDKEDNEHRLLLKDEIKKRDATMMQSGHKKFVQKYSKPKNDAHKESNVKKDVKKISKKKDAQNDPKSKRDGKKKAGEIKEKKPKKAPRKKVESEESSSSSDFVESSSEINIGKRYKNQ